MVYRRKVKDYLTGCQEITWACQNRHAS